MSTQNNNDTQKQQPVNIDKNANVGAGGGPLKCYIHLDQHGEPFTTDSMDEFNQHCHAFGHTLDGIRKCEDCDTMLVYKGIPYHDITPRGSTLVLRCDPCSDKHENKLKIVKTKGLIKEAGKYYRPTMVAPPQQEQLQPVNQGQGQNPQNK